MHPRDLFTRLLPPLEDPRASATIDAPLETVWEVMLDTARYGEWNPFVVGADCASPPYVGAPIVLTVVFGNGKKAVSPERISLLQPPYDDGGITRAVLAYDYEGLPAKLGLVRGRRYQRLEQRPGGLTRYDTVEEFRGPLVRLAGPDRVRDGFGRHAAALKVRCEGIAGSGHDRT